MLEILEMLKIQQLPAYGSTAEIARAAGVAAA
jgi:hypothetical protein